MNFHQYVANALEEDPGLDDETIADRIIEEGDSELIFPAVLFYVRSQRTSIGNRVLRMATREEPVSRSEGRTKLGPTTSENPSVPLIEHDPLASRRDILSTSKIVPGLGYIAIGDMTVVHHEARIYELKRNRDGLNESIRLHEQAIAEIEAAGVGCLNDIARGTAA